MNNFKILFAIGNPEPEYLKTRHNVGKLFLNFLLNGDMFSLENWQSQNNFFYAKKYQLILVKSNEYMNISGRSLKKVLNFFEATLDDVVVVYDDVSLELSVVRTKGKSSSGGHNGIKSIMGYFNTDDFKRVKIGIGPNVYNNLADFVLEEFSDDEIIILEEVFKNLKKDLMYMKKVGFKNTTFRYKKE